MTVQNVRYSQFDVEITSPLHDLLLAAGDSGAAVLVRRKGRPIAFWLQESRGVERITAGELARKISAEATDKIVAAAILEELAASGIQTPLPLVTIAICTKDRTAGVKRLLSSLQGQHSTLPYGSAGLDILIVDNAPSNELTRELADSVPGIRYVREPLPGLNFARNRAIREARGQILAFLDDDVVVDHQWVARLAAAYADNPDAAAFTGQVLPMELQTEAQIVFERRGGFRRGFDRIRFGAVLPGNALYPGGAGIFGAGANMAFQTDALRNLGGFDEALDTGAAIPGGGDLDIFYRVIRSGRALVYEPGFLVFHQHRREMDALLRQYRRSWGLGFMCYIRKCMKSDPQRRANLIRLIWWWIGYEVRGFFDNLTKKIRGRSHLPLSIFYGELFAGFAGLFGGYERSVRRVEAIRRRYRE
jgi:glycosyltransferase involved in cell wall biosynthesis